MKCLHPVRIFKNLPIDKFPTGLEVPCGQCMNCRIQKREEWSTRILHESEFWDSYIFFTLTYDEDNLPEKGSLRKRDLQLFFKRLRKLLGKRRIKYFACGEYGEDKGRPHYHVLMFGMDYISSDDRKLIKDSWTYCNWNMLGKNPFGDVSLTSIRYVAGYIEKEVLGDVERKYAYAEIEPPFRLMSKGIGRRYAETYRRALQKNGFIQVNGGRRSIPRYYADIAKIESDALREYSKEKEVELVCDLVGEKLDRDQLYEQGTTEKIIMVEKEVQRRSKQHDLNIKAKQLNRRRRRQTVF